MIWIIHCLAIVYFACAIAFEVARYRRGQRIELEQDTGLDGEVFTGLTDAVRENAAHRWPNHHPDEAVERFTHSLCSMNHYYRDQAREKEVERLAAAVADRTDEYSPANVGQVS